MGAKGAKIRIIYHKDFFPKDYSEEQIKKDLDLIKYKVHKELYSSIVPLLLKDDSKDKDCAKLHGTSLYLQRDDCVLLSTAKHVLFEDKEEKIFIANKFLYPNSIELESTSSFVLKAKERIDFAFLFLKDKLNDRFSPLAYKDYATSCERWIGCMGLGFPETRCKQKDDYIDSELIVYLAPPAFLEEVDKGFSKYEFALRFCEKDLFEECKPIQKFPAREGISGGPIFKLDDKLNFHLEGIYSRWMPDSLIGVNYDYCYAYLYNYIDEFKKNVSRI